jgi:predicted DNA-binding protein
MERINLNVPPEVRRRLGAVAKRLRKTEAETARELLIYALERTEREELCRRAVEATTAAVRARMLQIHEALEGLDG